MATPTTNTISGQSNGTIITYDPTLDLSTNGAISNALTTVNTSINNNHTALLTKLETITVAIEAALGATGSSTVGSTAHSLKQSLAQDELIVRALNRQMEIMAEMKSSIQTMSTQLNVLNSHAAGSVANERIMIAETATKNSFEQQATQTARREAGLPEVEVPQVQLDDQITNAVNNASIVAAQSKVTGFIDNTITEGFEYGQAKFQEYIGAPVTAAFRQIMGQQDKATAAAVNGAEIAAASVDDGAASSNRVA
jgi:hypothetical protein